MPSTTSAKTSAELPADGPSRVSKPGPRRPWTFLTNHGHVLITVAGNPDMLIRDIAATVGITQRGALHILADLEEAGYIHRLKSGRRTHYTVEEHGHFRHPSIAHQEIDALLDIFSAAPAGKTRKPPPGSSRTPGT